MSRAIRVWLWILGLTVLAQVVVPNAAAQALGGRLQQMTGAQGDAVSLTAIPFWILWQGQFQDVTMQARQWPLGSLLVSSIQVNWQNGGVNVADLLDHQTLVVTRAGQMDVTLKMDGPALAQFLRRDGRIKNPHVTIASDALTLSGTLQLQGFSGQITTRGRLAVSKDQRQILFQPSSVDGFGLPFPANIVIFNVDQMNLPLRVRITAVNLKPPFVVMRAVAP